MVDLHSCRMVGTFISFALLMKVDQSLLEIIKAHLFSGTLPVYP